MVLFVVVTTLVLMILLWIWNELDLKLPELPGLGLDEDKIEEQEEVVF